jgi:nucleoside 2-deoxyribosyltransferase
MRIIPKAPDPATAGSPVYCSGPMFSAGDKFEQEEVAAALESAHYTTYLPQRDGIEVGKIMELVDHPILEGYIADKIMLEVRKWVFALDMYQLLSRCQSVVFNLDGRTPDDGSVVETAAAFAAGKPIVIYKTTPITMLAGADNPMVQGLSSTWTYVGELKALGPAMAKAVAAAASYTYSAPANIVSLMSEGKLIWEILEDLRGVPTDTQHELAAFLNKIGEGLSRQPARA